MNKRSKYNKGKLHCIYSHPENWAKVNKILDGKSASKELIKTYLEANGEEFYQIKL
jgi:prephenate dehydratase